MNWFRVPAFVACRLHGDHVATEYEAWTDLLGRWHMGEDVSACAFAEATKWGKGRVLKFMPKVAEWAIEAGADLPKRWRADRSAVQDRTAHASNATEAEPTEPDSAGPESDRAPIHDRTASRARSSSERDQNRTDQMENNNMGGTPPEREITNPEKWAGLFQPTPPEAPAEPKPDPLVDAWTALTAWTPRPASWSFSAERRTKLKALVKQHGIEAVYTVARWMTSEHERARFLRERGDMSTLLRPGNFATYLAMAETGIVTAPRPAAPPRPNAPTPFVSIAEMRKALQSTPTPTPQPRAGVVIDIEEAN